MTQDQRIRRISKSRSPLMATATALFMAIALLAIPLPAAAHPPTALGLSYDTVAKTLTVEITHASGSPGTHFIKTVEITRDGKPFSKTTYTSQPSQATFSYTYPLDDPGEVVEVTVSCSISGSRSDTLRARKTLR